MRRLAKKIAASALALTLTVGMCTSVFGAAWGSYFGASAGWYEGADGSLTTNTATGWTASMNAVGWGGCWGGQVFQNAAEGTEGVVNIAKGKKYTISFSISSSNCTKYVYLKIATGEVIAFHDWIALKRGETVNYSKTFTADNNATSVYFGIGGDYGDRLESEEFAKVRYDILPDYANVLQNDADGDSTAATVIKVANYKLAEAANTKPAKVKLKSVKAAKGGATVKYAKAANAAGYQVKYKAGKKTFTKDAKNKLTYKIKKVKKGTKITVQVRAYAAGKKQFGVWSSKKSVKAK